MRLTLVSVQVGNTSHDKHGSRTAVTPVQDGMDCGSNHSIGLLADRSCVTLPIWPLDTLHAVPWPSPAPYIYGFKPRKSRAIQDLISSVLTGLLRYTFGTHGQKANSGHRFFL